MPHRKIYIESTTHHNGYPLRNWIESNDDSTILSALIILSDDAAEMSIDKEGDFHMKVDESQELDIAKLINAANPVIERTGYRFEEEGGQIALISISGEYNSFLFHTPKTILNGLLVFPLIMMDVNSLLEVYTGYKELEAEGII